MVEILDLDQAKAWRAAAAVPDPEVPCVTVADLGILRSVDLVDGVAVAKVTPTYNGCPAVLAIELAVEAALRDAGFEARIERVIAPALPRSVPHTRFRAKFPPKRNPQEENPWVMKSSTC